MGNYDVIIIGGGASGMMAAGHAGKLGKKVLLIEKNNSLGEKLKITGGGRCNITNAEEDIRIFMKNYGKSEHFLYSPFSIFGVPETISFFESIGVPIVVQARKRAFPKTEKAIDVYKALEKFIKKSGVEILINTKVIEIKKEGDQIKEIITNKGIYKAKKYILATGGVSHPETGSTGDGFIWLKNLGHKIIKPTPTIVPIKISEKWVHELSGNSISNMKISFFIDGKKSFSKTGELLFTHFGLSGPLILNSAYQISELLDIGKVTGTIDIYPNLDNLELEQKILSIFDQNKNKDLKNILNEILQPGLQSLIQNLIPSIDLSTKVHSISKEHRKEIIKTIKSLPITVTGLMGYDRAVVADGGVPLEEIDLKTFNSKIIKNLSITGDLLHITRPSGGFSLQLCWTSGYLAGTNS